MEKTRIQKYYSSVVVEDLLILYNCRNVMQLPRLDQGVLNISSKNFLIDKQEILKSFAACFLLTGQKGVTTRARKSIAAFQLRKGNMLGCMVTVRRSKMFALLDKILTFVLPCSHGMRSGAHQPKIFIPKGKDMQDTLQRRVLYTPQSHSDFEGAVLPASAIEVADLYLGSATQPLPNNSHKYLQFGVKEPTLFPEIENAFEGLSLIKGLNIVFSLSSQGEKRKRYSRSYGREHLIPSSLRSRGALYPSLSSERYQDPLPFSPFHKQLQSQSSEGRNKIIVKVKTLAPLAKKSNAHQSINSIFFSAFQCPNVSTRSA